MDNFNLEHQYSLYLQRVDLKEDEMHPEQRRQLKQTFFAACGQLIILFRDELTLLSEDDGANQLHSMLNQVGAYFLLENNSKN